MEVTEEELEEEEEGTTARRAQSPESPTELTEENDEKAVDTPVKETSFSKVPIAEADAEFNREVGTVVNPRATIEEEAEKTVSSGQVSPVHDFVVVNQRTDDQQPSTSTQQDEPLEVELLGTLEEVIGSEGHPEISFEIVLGTGGTYTPRFAAGSGSHDNPEDATDENKEEPLSEKAAQVQEATVWVPEVIKEAAKSINSAWSSTEREEDAQEGEVSGEDRGGAVEAPPESEVTEITTREKVTFPLKDTFVRQETADELYSKVLRAVICYKREKATYEQYKIYKAQIAALSKGKEEVEPPSTSPTIEAEREVDELINRAEKIATERSARLKKIQEEALKVSDTIEEARWRVYDLFREQINTDKGSVAERPVGEIQGIDTQSIPDGNQQKKDSLVTGSEEREESQRKELRSSSAAATSNRGKTLEKRVPEVNEQSQEEFLESLNQTKTGEETSEKRNQKENLALRETFDPFQREKLALSEERGATAVTYRNEDESCQNQGFKPLKDCRSWSKSGKADEIQRKVSQLDSERAAAIEGETTPSLEGLRSRTKTWVAQHQRQLVGESGEELSQLRWSASPEESGKPTTNEGSKELNPIELENTPPRRETPGRTSDTPGGSSGYLGETWGRTEGTMARLPNIKLPLFYGKEGENYERFFDEMAGLKRISGWGPDEYLDIVKIGIKGGAAAWLKAVPRDDQDSLTKVKAIIKEAFGDKRPRWQRHRDLHNLRQEKGQSVRDFALKIKEYALPDDVDDGQLLSVFVAGLPRHIGMELAKSELTSLDKAVAQAVRIESVDKRGPDRKPEVMVLEMDRNMEPRREQKMEINMREFDGMMENQFMEYQPQDQSNQRGYNRGQSNYRGRGRYQNQGEYNNRMQGSQPGGQLTEYEYKQRSIARAAEYKRMMKLQTGGASVVPTDSPEGGSMQRYCIIHDSRSHTTAQCDLLKEIYQNKEEPVNQARTKQVTFVPTNQGN